MSNSVLSVQYKRNEEIVSTEMDDSLMMMSVEEGKYFELNIISKRIWEILEFEKSIEEVINQLLLEFDISREVCTKDVVNHFEELETKKIIFRL